MAEEPWKWPPGKADETTILVGFLERQRAILEWKTNGLDAEAMRTKVGRSSITLGGLLKHMAHAEDHWFCVYLNGEEPHPPWNTEQTSDWQWEWQSASADPAEQLHSLWHDSVARSRSRISQALTRGGLDDASHPPKDEGIGSPSLRWIICHMIEEYARHLGHADLIRESVDGFVGEDPGWD